MKTSALLRNSILSTVLIAHGVAFSQPALTYDVTALVDVADVLVLQGTETQWYHPGSGAAVGRHNGNNEATVITSTVDGVTNLGNFAWIPDWPEAPPAEISYEAYSSVLSNLAPALPQGTLSVGLAVLDGRGSVSIDQSPQATNNWRLMVRFADGATGSALLTARISVHVLPHPMEFIVFAGPSNGLFRFEVPLTPPTPVADADLGAGTFALVEDGPVLLYAFNTISDSVSVYDRFDGQPVATTPLDQDVFGTRRGFDRSPEGVIYGVLPGMQLRTVDPVTGTTTFITNITGAARVETIAFAPDGTLYASGSIADNSTSETLFTLHPETGVLTPVGQMNVTDVDEFTFGPDGYLYGVDSQAGETHLLRIDPATAFVDDLGSTGLTEIRGIVAVRQPVTLSVVRSSDRALVRWPTNTVGFRVQTNWDHPPDGHRTLPFLAYLATTTL